MTLFEMLWNRTESGFQTMRVARVEFREKVEADSTAARIGLASAHHTLVKRYLVWYKKPIALWHAWRALRNLAMLDRDITKMSVDEIETSASIWSKYPGWLGGDLDRARTAGWYALYDHPRSSWMKPHTRALLYITMGTIEYKIGDSQDHAIDWYDKALKLVDAILNDSAPDRYLQGIRVLKNCGFFYYNYQRVPPGMDEPIDLILKAVTLAKEHSRDQLEDIVLGCRQRNIVLEI